MEAKKVTRHIFLVEDSDVEVEHEIETGVYNCDLIFRDKETTPSTEIIFPIDLLSTLAEWAKGQIKEAEEAAEGPTDN